ncbi:MAG: hypothetical protein ACKOBM_00705, partial [Gammaproteobacteria bacterium]
SVDDPGSDPLDFEARVMASARAWLARDLPPRTQAVLAALSPDWRQRLRVLAKAWSSQGSDSGCPI